MLIAIFPVLVALLGVVMWVAFATSNPKLSEAGRLMFFCGMLVTTWILGQHVVRVG